MSPKFSVIIAQTKNMGYVLINFFLFYLSLTLAMFMLRVKMGTALIGYLGS